MCDEFTRIQLESYLLSLGIEAFPEQWWEKIVLFHEFLIQKNQSLNLTRITSFDRFLIKHIVDSLSLITILPNFINETFEVADVGCGPGFPGIPLALFSPTSRFTEIESCAKKVVFLNSALGRLRLRNCRVIQSRARELSRMSEFGKAFDLVLARAVNKVPYLIRECRKLLRNEAGMMIIYKTPGGLKLEESAIRREVKRYNLFYRFTPIFELPENCGKRQFCLVTSHKPTLEKLNLTTK